jgi:hypothetical protein
MTKPGFYLGVVLFGLAALLGALLAAPTKTELGLSPTMRCDAFRAEPRVMSDVRLTDCPIYFGEIEWAEDEQGRIEAAAVQVGEPGDPLELYWATTDERALAVAERARACNGDEDCWLRYLERSDRALIARRDIGGELLRPSEGDEDLRAMLGWDELWEDPALDEPIPDEPRVVDERPDSKLERRFGLVLLGFAALALVVLIRAQRKWSARRAALMGNSQPLEF